MLVLSMFIKENAPWGVSSPKRKGTRRKERIDIFPRAGIQIKAEARKEKKIWRQRRRRRDDACKQCTKQSCWILSWLLPTDLFLSKSYNRETLENPLFLFKSVHVYSKSCKNHVALQPHVVNNRVTPQGGMQRGEIIWRRTKKLGTVSQLDRKKKSFFGGLFSRRHGTMKS